jgi:23S rRNA (cytosine1962-C5)-methyltransferase
LSGPPRTARSPREIVLKQRTTAERLRRGHPWVWREAIARGLDGASAGEEVRVLAPDGTVVGHGLADPGSQIAVRLWTHDSPVDAALLSSRISSAFALRSRVIDEATDAYRLVHGEGDRMPGLALDRYAGAAVLRCDSEAVVARLPELTEILWPALASIGVGTLIHRTGKRGNQPILEVLRGESIPGTLEVREHGVRFAVDVAHGQKTGAFLDQRENRVRVGELARGRRMLNLFSYAGGFALHALVRGCSAVTNVDMAVGAHRTAQQSLHAAGIEPSRSTFVTADVEEFLRSARRRKERWDFIVSDPPSFAPSERALPRALAAYRGLHRACVDVLAPGGFLCASSCSSHVDAATFLRTLDDSAVGGRALSLLELRGAGPDHPTLPAFPEGHYLKFAVLYAA